MVWGRWWYSSFAFVVIVDRRIGQVTRGGRPFLFFVSGVSRIGEGYMVNVRQEMTTCPVMW